MSVLNIDCGESMVSDVVDGKICHVMDVEMRGLMCGWMDGDTPTSLRQYGNTVADRRNR